MRALARRSASKGAGRLRTERKCLRSESCGGSRTETIESSESSRQPARLRRGTVVEGNRGRRHLALESPCRIGTVTTNDSFVGTVTTLLGKGEI